MAVVAASDGSSISWRPSGNILRSSSVAAASESPYRDTSRNSSLTNEAFPLRKVEVLQALDGARIQWYHFATVLVAGCGFFTDAYDLFSITIVTKLLGRIHYTSLPSDTPGQLPFNVRLAVSAVALCGTFAGALFFGCMGDRFGRRKVYGITLILMILCSIGSGLSFGSTAKSVITTLCFFRFWLGFGIGGDYPLSATIMSEYANVKSRGMFIAAVFALQGFGILFAATVGLIVSAIFNHYKPSPSFSKDAELSTPAEADFMWRAILMLGALPALLTLYFRLRIAETPRYTALVTGDIAKATRDIARLLEEGESGVQTRPVSGRWEAQKRAFFSTEFRRRFGKQLFGTCAAWFLLDITFYSQNLFQDEVLTDVGWLPASKSMSAGEEVFNVSKSQAFIALCATVPGYWVTVATVEKLGRRTIQLQGFLFMSIFTLIVGLAFNELRGQMDTKTKTYTGGRHVLFITLYAVIFFFSNFGPNTTTFIVPAELFPATLRSTCFGMSAAAGKLGAVVGAFGFLYATQSSSNPERGYPPGIGPRGAFLMLAFLNLVGIFVTYLCIPETKGKSLEELSGDFEDGIMLIDYNLDPVSE